MRIINLPDEVKVLIEEPRPGAATVSIVSSEYSGQTFWGAMGSDFDTFIKEINEFYFSDRFCKHERSKVFSPKSTLKSVRKAIRGEFRWFEFMEHQKDLREELRHLDHCKSEDIFIVRLQEIPDKILAIESTKDEDDEFTERLKSITDDVYYLIEHDESREYKWWRKIHGQLVKAVKKEQHELQRI